MKGKQQQQQNNTTQHNTTQHKTNVAEHSHINLQIYKKLQLLYIVYTSGESVFLSGTEWVCLRFPINSSIIAR